MRSAHRSSTPDRGTPVIVNAAPRGPFCPVEIPLTAARCLLGISVAFVIASIAPPALDAQHRTIAVSGRVRDARSGEPVVAVSVLFDSVIVAATDETGRFQTPELQVGDPTVLLFFRRIGYATTVREIEVPELGAVVQVDVTLAPSPTGLEQIVVAGERVVLTNPGLAGFYERRELDFGRYLTEEEIDRSKGYDLAPQLRRLRVPIGLADLRDPFGKPTFRQCYIAYLDGIRLMDLSTIDQWVPASHLAAIEFYGDERYHRLPGEFIPVGPFDEICGVILFWSKAPRRPSPVEFGGHLSAQLAGDRGGGQFVGGRIVIPVRGALSTLQLRAAFDARLGDAGDRWRAFINVTLRPLGYSSPWYAGTGFALVKPDSDFGSEDGGNIEPHHTVVTGLRIRWGKLRPFLELQVLDPLRPTQAAAFSFLGVSYRFDIQ